MYRFLFLTIIGLAVRYSCAQKVEAKCEIIASNSDPNQKISGIIRLMQDGNGTVVIGVNLAGFTAQDGVTQHGFHIHTNDDIGGQCANVGAHYNPGNRQHGSPTDPENKRHVGDLGNIDENNDNGRVDMVLSDNLISIRNGLSGRYNVIGLPMVVHAKRDDLGQGGAAESLTTGDSGAKIGCCIITKTKNPEYNNAKCTLQPGKEVGGQKLSGDITMKQLKQGGMVSYELDISGFSTTDSVTEHGFHVHEVGEVGNLCLDAQSHFNPDNVNHGDLGSLVRHVGDLGNIKEVGSTVKTTIYDAITSIVAGPNDIRNRAIVIHEKKDDLGLGGTASSLLTGNAGARLACCVIEENKSSPLTNGGKKKFSLTSSGNSTEPV